MKRTMGGIPIEQAWHWDERTKKMFGDIIYRLYSPVFKTREHAYNDYYEMGRHFIRDEWDDQMERFAELRARAGAFSIEEALKEISEQIVTRKAPPKSIFDTTEEKATQLIPAPIIKKEKRDDLWQYETAQQLSLF